MNERGQASIEVVAFLPLVLVVALAVFSVIAAHAADEEAGQAAEAAALALLQGRDPRAAANAALPARARRHARVEIHGTQVRVHVRPRLPILADRLAGDERANAAPDAP